MIEGLWTDLRGSKCNIIAHPTGIWTSETWLGTIADQVYTIEDIYFKVDRDGKFRASIKLVEVPDRLFRPAELKITGICPGIDLVGELCGEFDA